MAENRIVARILSFRGLQSLHPHPARTTVASAKWRSLHCSSSRRNGDKNGDKPFVATTRWRDIRGGCTLLSAVSSVLFESDMRLILVGWDMLPEMVVTETGISSTGSLQDETNANVPSAGRALLRDLAADYPGLASLGGDRWENRISWLDLKTWRNQSRLPSVIATAPCSLAPLSSASYDYGCPREALPTGTDINTDHPQHEGCASSSPVLDSSSSQHPSVIANAE